MKELFLILANSIGFQLGLETEVIKVTDDDKENGESEQDTIDYALENACSAYEQSQRNTLVLTQEHAKELLPILQKFIALEK